MKMPTRTFTALDRLYDKLEKREAPLDSEILEEIAEHIGSVFRVQRDEVAVLELSPSGKALRFVLPEKLQAVGEIPLTSTTALAARTARERRSDIVNNFATSRHASVFEGVPLGRRQDEVIHKIMSVPVLLGDKVIGVAQISRKGASPLDAGPDFTPRDLGELQGLSTLLRRLLALPRAE